MSLIRYPGSKEKLAASIKGLFPDSMQFPLWSNAATREYREPFFGAGAVGFRVLKILDPSCSVWLNDKDPGMASLWRAVMNHADELIDLVGKFGPSTDWFYQFKEEDGRTDLGDLRQGFRKLALHRMSYSGLGAMSGGPLGGRNQSGEYNVGCRWNAETIKSDIRKLSNRLNRFDNIRITCGDFGPLITDAPESSFIYLDPPYVEKGPELYKHCMSDDDHSRLAKCLRETAPRWVLSYDDHDMIRTLYDWAEISEIELTYTTAFSKGKRPKNQEILITPSQVVTVK